MENKQPTWKKNFAKGKPSANPVPVPPSANPDIPPKKTGSTCGNPVCCMRQVRTNITYEGPTMLDGNGNDRGGYTFKGIEPPMLCAGSAWMPKQLTKWERQRKEAAGAPGLNDFRKKK